MKESESRETAKKIIKKEGVRAEDG